MTIRPIHTVSEGYAFSPANGIAADVMYEKTDKKYRRGSLLSRRWAALSRKKKAGVLLSAFVLMYILGALYRSTTQDDIVLVTSTDDLPLVTVEHDFLAANDYRSLMEKVAVHPRLVPHGRPKGEVGSKGVHVHFNTGGIQRLKEDPDVSMFFPIFESVRWVDANFWKLNFFFSETAEGMVPESGVWGVHHDVLIGSRLSGTDGLDLGSGPGVQLYSHVTTLLYLDFPTDMHGGNLWVWDPSADPLSEDGAGALPAMVILPKRNTLVQFRGDSFHGVSSHNTSTNNPRISLVFEQFKVPTRLYARSWEWLLRVYRNAYMLTDLARAPFTPTTAEQCSAAQELLRHNINTQ